MGNITNKWVFCPSARTVQADIKAVIKRVVTANFAPPTVQHRAGNVQLSSEIGMRRIVKKLTPA